MKEEIITGQTGVWAIGDEAGVIHTGTEDEMNCAMQIMTWDEKTLKNMHQEERLAELKSMYRVPHKGKLIMSKL